MVAVHGPLCNPQNPSRCSLRSQDEAVRDGKPLTGELRHPEEYARAGASGCESIRISEEELCSAGGKCL